MARPDINPRIKEPCQQFGIRINSGQIRAFECITLSTCNSQVLVVVATPMLPCDYMLNLQAKGQEFSRNVAVFTPK